VEAPEIPTAAQRFYLAGLSIHEPLVQRRIWRAGGGFQVGQTAKARPGRRVQSLHKGQDTARQCRPNSIPSGVGAQPGENCRNCLDSPLEVIG
jgi:hypothetical protein